MPHSERAARLADAVMAHPAVASLEPGAWVTCYSSYRDEPPTRLLLQRLCDAGFEVLVPAVHGTNLHWHDVTGEVDDPKAWTRDSYGIPVPTTPEVATTAHELLTLGVRVIITPGLGMERSGARIGQGGGFYDRFFARVPRHSEGGPFRLGITHFGGLLPDGTIDLLPHDQSIDDVIEG
jgi:5-formyltetrahydrofolate cyclo-ligase